MVTTGKPKLSNDAYRILVLNKQMVLQTLASSSNPTNYFILLTSAAQLILLSLPPTASIKLKIPSPAHKD